MSTPERPTLKATRMTRAQRAALPLAADVIQALAEQHGVCVRPLAMRRIDTTTGCVEVVPVPCGSTREDQCPPCAEKARWLRMAQCREGWHLDTEPDITRTPPSHDHQELMATRADLAATYTECQANGDAEGCEQIAESVAELDTELRALGVRGRLTPLAIRGTIPRAELRAITAAAYHQVWWPHHDQPVYGEDRLPVWDPRAKAFIAPTPATHYRPGSRPVTNSPNPPTSCDSGNKVHVKGIPGGTEEAGRHIGKP
jgi:hypothetical protein